MRTNLVQTLKVSAKRINLNRTTRRVALIGLFITISVGETWGGSTTYYSELTATASPTGGGKVYASLSDSDGSFSSASASTSSTSGSTFTFYVKAVPNNGYYFTTWTKGTNVKSINSATKAQTSCVTNGGTDNPTNAAITASFANVTVSSVAPTSVTFTPSSPSATATDNTGALTFTTASADAKEDFALSVATTAGSGTFSATYDSWASNSAGVTWKFVGNGSYGGGSHGSRVNTGTVTLSSAGGESSKTVTITATYPNVTIPSVSVDDLFTSPTKTVSGTAEFIVDYVDDIGDFATPTISGTGGTWSLGSATYNSSTGIVSVPYTFTAGSAEGEFSATLTLTAIANAGSTSKSATINATVEAISENDASVTTLANVTTVYPTWAEALAAANASPGSTLKLLRNVSGITTAQTIANSITIDLNSFTLSGTTATRLLYLNTADKILTIKSSRAGGKIVATATAATQSAIEIAKGNLVLMSGTINLTSSAATAYGIKAAAGTQVAATGGTINVTAASEAYGIYAANKLSLSGVTINATTTGTTGAYAVYSTSAAASETITDVENLPTLIYNGSFTATAQTGTAFALRTVGHAAVNNGVFTATAGTITARAAYVEGGSLIVRNGTFTATAATEQAHAIQIANGAKALIYGGTFTGNLTGVTAASKYASGAHVMSGGTLEAQLNEAINTTGPKFRAELNGTATSVVQDYACAVYAPAGSKVTLSGATLEAVIKGTKNYGAYGIYSATTNAMSVVSSSIVATSECTTAKDNNAIGVWLNGNTPLTISNTTADVSGATGYNYGLKHSSTQESKVSNCTFTVLSNNTYAYGAYLNKGTLTSENSIYNSTILQSAATSAADGTLRGIYVAAGAATLNLTNSTINVSGNATYTNTAIGVQTYGTSVVANSTININSVRTGYCFYQYAATTSTTIGSGKFKVSASTTTAVPFNNLPALVGKTLVYGGYFSSKTYLEQYVADGYSVADVATTASEYPDYPYYVTSGTGTTAVCRVNGIDYSTLEGALEYCNKNAGKGYTILMLEDYTLPAGDYILPSGFTLLIPKSGQTSAQGTNAKVVTTTVTPSKNKLLTFASNANLTVLGTIETGGDEYSANGGASTTGRSSGACGMLRLNANSHITLESGAKLISWGYVYGAGTIEAKSGSATYENFELATCKGGTIMTDVFVNYSGTPKTDCFPIDDYFVQNIESEITYRPGANAYASTSLNIPSGSSNPVNGLKIVGTASDFLFMMSTDAVRPNMWVRKKYNPNTDRCTWTLNDGAQLSSITIKIASYSINSANFVLPIASNMDIEMNYGTLSIASGQNIMLIPGAKVIVKKDAILQIPSGVKFYVYDVAQWGLTKPGSKYVFSSNYQPDRPSNHPRKNFGSDKTGLLSGEIFVQGTLEVSGTLQTTEGGAYIHSTDEDAGVVHYKSAATASGSVKQYTSTGMVTNTTTSAKLQNGDASYTGTTGTAAGEKWIYKNGVWVKVSTSGCFTVETIGTTEHYYAHPKDWVEVTANSPDDHAYHVTSDPTRYVIQGKDCNWIEVVPEDGYYKCINENSIYYNSYFEWSGSNGYWVEKFVTIKFDNQGSVTTYSNIPYKSIPAYEGATPSKTATTTSYFTFIGWNADGVTYSKDEALPAATANVTYTAVFEEHCFKTNVIFYNYDQNSLANNRWCAGEIPSYAGTPVKPSTVSTEYIFTGWNTALNGSGTNYPVGTNLPAVTYSTSPIKYYAQFSSRTRKYNITFVNHDGTILEDASVDYGTTPVYGGATPEHVRDAYYSYTFNGWSPSLASVTGDATYTATYTYKIKTYNITYLPGANGTGSVAAGEKTHGVAFTLSSSTFSRDEYTQTGWSTSDGGAKAYDLGGSYTANADLTLYPFWTMTSATYNIIYKDQGNVDFSGVHASGYPTTHTYGTATALKTATKEGYTFGGWFTTSGCTGSAVTSLGATAYTADITLYAKWTVKTYAITYNKGANGTGTIAAGTKTHDVTFTLSSSKFTREGYTQTGWSTSDGGAKAYDLGGSYTANAAITLYPYWTINTYAITYDKGTNGTGTIAAGTKTHNVTFTLSSSKFTREGYTQTGWSTSDGGAKAYDLGGSYTANAAITLYPFWEAQTYNITYKDQGNVDFSGVHASGYPTTHTYGTATALKTATKEGYQFDGWFTTSGCTGSAVTSLGATAYTADITLYAKWTINTFTLNVAVAAASAGYGSVAPATVSGVPYNTTVDKSSNTFTVNGTTVTATPTTNTAQYTYAFVRWDNLPAKVTSNVSNIEAVFSRTTNTYTITWKSEDGTGTLETDENVEFGTSTSFDAAAPTKPATAQYTYTFDGWATEANGDKVYEIGATPTVGGAATYYAHFSATTNKYTVTWKNEDGTTLETDENVAYGATPNYDGATPTKAADAEYTYTFNGWTPAIASVTGDATYTAQFAAVAIPDKTLDIVDWTSSSITINVTNLKTNAGNANWKIRVNDTDYSRSACNTTTRTLTITGLSLTPDNSLLIQVKNNADQIEGQHSYTIPHIYTSNATLSGTTNTSVVYVNSGKLTVSGNTTLAALYIGPGAQVEVTSGTLTTSKLVLRTKPWATAAISGSISATNTYYTRIAPDGQDGYEYGKYYQFGLPYGCAISSVRLSDGTTPAYTSTWLLKKYNEEKRATNGANGANWDAVASSGAIEAGQGYEMFSSVKYYREYYFPVTPTDNQTVSVTRYGNDELNSGWNIVCSPLMSVYKNTSDPATGIKVSWLQTDGSYVQEWPEYIWPALPFSYQAADNGNLDFSTSNFHLGAPRRRVAEEENIQTEWIHLDVTDRQDVGDQTSIFVHPSRFLNGYETSIDVAKQSLTASRAILYSSHAYGDMAFAGVADSLLERGVALTLYSPSEQELTISMRINDWLDRMEYVWLIDHETGAQIDLLSSNYSFVAASGTTRGRFTIGGVFRTPQIATDIEPTSDSSLKGREVRKVIIDQKIFIQVGDRLYDSTGKLVEGK